jgi:shikimate kinase
MEQPQKSRSIAIIGLPASGKTTTSRLLARLLGIPARDLDDVIVEDAGRDIPSIFASEGEEGFREREHRALERVSEAPRLVLATGGGIILQPENRLLLKKNFLTVWLKVSPETAAARSVGGTRPLLMGADALTRIRELASVRSPLYAECVDLVVDTEGLAPEAVAKAIHDKVG